MYYLLFAASLVMMAYMYWTNRRETETETKNMLRLHTMLYIDDHCVDDLIVSIPYTPLRGRFIEDDLDDHAIVAIDTFLSKREFNRGYYSATKRAIHKEHYFLGSSELVVEPRDALQRMRVVFKLA